MPIFHEFPYGNLHDQNYDWILQSIKTTLDRYKDLDDNVAHALELIEAAKDGSLSDIQTALESALAEINESIEGIGEAETDALNHIQLAKTSAVNNITSAEGTAIQNISTEKTDALNDIATAKADAQSAIAADKTGAQSAIATDKADAQSAIAADKTDAQSAITTDKTNAQTAIETDRANAVSSIDNARLYSLQQVSTQMAGLIDQINALRQSFPADGDILIGDVRAAKSMINNVDVSVSWFQGYYANPPYAHDYPDFVSDSTQVSSVYLAGCQGLKMYIVPWGNSGDAINDIVIPVVYTWNKDFTTKVAYQPTQENYRLYSIDFSSSDVWFSIVAKRRDGGAIVPGEVDGHVGVLWQNDVVYYPTVSNNIQRTATARKNYSVGELIIFLGNLYRVLQPIQQNATINFYNDSSMTIDTEQITIESLLNEKYVPPSNAQANQFLMFNGTAWVAANLPTYQGGVSNE